MPDTSLQWMRVDSSCLLLHQEGNADPMRKAIAKSAFLKPNQFEIGIFRINKSWQPSAWIKDLPNCTQMTFGMDHSSMVHSSKSQTLINSILGNGASTLIHYYATILSSADERAPLNSTRQGNCHKFMHRSTKIIISIKQRIDILLWHIKELPNLKRTPYNKRREPEMSRVCITVSVSVIQT